MLHRLDEIVICHSFGMKLGLRAEMILGIEMKYFKYTYDACVRAEYFRLVNLLYTSPSKNRPVVSYQNKHAAISSVSSPECSLLIASALALIFKSQNAKSRDDNCHSRIAQSINVFIYHVHSLGLSFSLLHSPSNKHTLKKIRELRRF